MALDLHHVLSGIALRSLEIANHDLINDISLEIISDMPISHDVRLKFRREYFGNDLLGIISGHPDDTYATLTICS